LTSSSLDIARSEHTDTSKATTPSIKESPTYSRPRISPPRRSSDKSKKPVQAAITSLMILRLVAHRPVPARRDFSGISAAPHWALSDTDRLDHRERTIVP
jgi:hypothetical protein